MNKIPNKPKFSIITVSYNHEQYIDQTIQSVLNQTLTDFEYLIVDGKSTDNSRKVIEKYTKDLRLKPIFQNLNEGAVSSLNEGFKNAKGEILGYINSDDFYLENTLRDVENLFLNNPSIDIIFGNGYLVNNKDIIVKDFFSKNFSLKRLKTGQYLICQQATFFRKKIFNQSSGFNPLNKRSWDMELFIDMVKNGAKFKRVDNFLGCFRIHEDTVTSKGNSKNRKENQDHIYNKYFTEPLTLINKIEKIFIYLFDRLNIKFLFNKIKIIYYKIKKIRISKYER
jgi:glycosyltransferase involved in cell wall biosynthesis